MTMKPQFSACICTAEENSAPQFRISRRAGKDDVYEGYGIRIPITGQIMIPDYGCIRLHPDHELVLEGKGASAVFEKSMMFLLPQNEPEIKTYLTSGYEQILLRNKNYPCSPWEAKYVSQFPICWEFSNSEETVIFLHVQDAVKYFAETEEHLPKFLSKQIYRSSSCLRMGIFSCYDKGHVTVIDGTSKQEMTELQKYEHLFCINDDVRMPENVLPHMERNMTSIRYLFDTSFSQRKHKKGKYAAQFFPLAPSVGWFILGRRNYAPEWYTDCVQPDGSILLPLPCISDKWSEEKKQAAIDQFMKINLNLFFMGFKRIEDDPHQT